MTLHNNILTKSKELATDILQNQLSPDLTYHNYEHTKGVVDAALLIGTAENLTEDELETVLIAAWFHDTGFREAGIGHEAKSAEIAKEFLTSEKVDSNKIETIIGCIHATQMGKIPNNKLQEILCDADLFHTSVDNYEEYADRLRKEMSATEKKMPTDIQWLQTNIEFLSKLNFHSSYGHKVLRPAKDHVRKKMQKKLNKLHKQLDQGMINELGVTPEELKAMKKKLQKAKGRPERGIETMFRLTSKNHLTLSGMADSKANIVISVNSIILSIIIGALMQKLDSNPHLLAPTAILLLINLGSMVFAILSIRPNVTKGLFTREDIENQRTNLLFFGNFHKMKRNDYHWGMNQLMDNADFLYSSLIDDIYFLGVVLATKYKLLRISYNIFMYGMVIAVVAFLAANYFAETPF